jgi:ATP-binding protein involved in chromosome partitioning
MDPSHPNFRPAVWNREPVAGVRHLIAVGAGKGGVGKSSVTVLLAHALTAQGKRVGILDADLYGPSIPRMLGLPLLKPELKHGLMLPATAHGIRAQSVAFLTGGEAAVVRGPIVTKSLTQLLRGSYWAEPTAPLDIVLIDLPPGTGDVPLSLAQAAPLDGAILVTTPQEIAVMDARKAGDMFKKLRVPLLGIIENMSYFADSAGIRHTLFGEGGGEALAQELGIPLLAKLPLDPTLGAAMEAGENYLAARKEHPIFAATKF